jgi:predicted nicotinamide N-methyase
MESRRAFVLHHTRLRPVAGLEPNRLHLSDEVLPLWHDLQVATRDPDAPLPYWAFAWAGGLALARFIGEHPEVVRDRSVLDVGTGSGLCSIAAARAGASSVTAIDIDPHAVAAARLNAKANAVRIDVLERDVVDEPPPDVDVVLAGDCWYEIQAADRITGWLTRAASAGAEVFVGDPGRRYLPLPHLDELATYEVRTTTELEDLAQKTARVHRLRATAAPSQAQTRRIPA